VAENMLRGRITDEAVALMRRRIGYSNPTIRTGVRQPPQWTAASHDAIRHWTRGYGDDNPLYVDPNYGAHTRWGGQIGPPGFERTIAESRPGPQLAPDEDRETSRALRGVQLYHSGDDMRWYRPVRLGDWCMSRAAVHDVQDKKSEFAGRSVIVTNRNLTWNSARELVSESKNWFVHAERRKVSDGESNGRRQPVEPAHYTDADLAEIEAAYDAEYRRGPKTLYYEEVESGTTLPRMVKGPLTITDMINMHMGGGWFGYGNPALRLGYQNRKRMRGFYTKNRFGAWDVMQRVHWEEQAAHDVGVPLMYDIGPMRWAWLVHYCTNWMGDDAWLFRLRGEFRRFNYFGDTTWIDGMVRDVYLSEHGPAVDLELTGTSQRGEHNIVGTATILVASREHGPMRLPTPPPTESPDPAERWSLGSILSAED
jgi:acyl dehydratase